MSILCMHIVDPIVAMSKTKILNLRIEPDLKKAAKKLADADGRSLSNWVTRLIQREVDSARNGKSTKKR